jgi:hypothetical protein
VSGFIILYQDSGQVLNKIIGFIPGADNNRNRLLQRLFFCRRPVKRQPSEKKQIIKKLNYNHYTKNGKNGLPYQ